MRHEIIFSPESIDDLHQLRANARTLVREAIDEHLRYQPEKVSKSRIKRLKGLLRPQYRLRVGDDIRVFYDVVENSVQVLAIVMKSNADVWLKSHGESDETDPAV